MITLDIVLDMVHPFFGMRKIAVALALIAGLLICRAVLAAEVAHVEAESMSHGSFASVVPDPSAAGGYALMYTSDGTATKEVTTQAGDTVVVVARGPVHGSSRAELAIILDGVTLNGSNGEFLRSSSYTRYAVTKNVPAGTHTLGIGALNATSKRPLFADAYVLEGETTEPIPNNCDKYASPTGADTNPGTKSAPYKTAEKLAANTGAGQRGCLEPGTYTEADQVVSISSGGTSESARKVITTTPGSDSRARINATIVGAANARYVTLGNLRLDGSYGKVCGSSETCAVKPSPILNGDYNTIRNSEITNRRAGMEATRAGICVHANGGATGDRTLGLRVVNNNIHHCGRVPRYEPGLDHAVYLSNTRGAYVAHNLIWEQTDKGINLRIDADGTLIEKNVMDSNGVGVMFGAGNGLTSDNNEVRNNLITNSDHRYNIESCCADGNTFVGNVVHHNCVWGGKLGNVGSGSSVLGFTYRDNIAADPLYTDSTHGDFTLLESSPCANVLSSGP